MSDQKYNGLCAGKDAISDFISDMRKLQEAAPEIEQLDEAKKKTSMKMEMDVNGNRVLRISSPEGSFTIQTNANLPDIHSRKIELDSQEAFDYVDEYLKKHGATGKRQSVWNAYGVYSGFDKQMNEEFQIDEAKKFDVKKASAIDFLSMISGTRSDNFESWAKEAGLSLDKMFKHALDQNTKGGLPAATEFGKDIMTARVGKPNNKVMSQFKKMFSEEVELDEGVGVPVKNALKILLDDGLDEADLEAVAKELDNNSGYVNMDKVRKVAKKYGVTMGKGMFEETQLDETVRDYSGMSKSEMDDLAAERRRRDVRRKEMYARVEAENKAAAEKKASEKKPEKKSFVQKVKDTFKKVTEESEIEEIVNSIDESTFETFEGDDLHEIFGFFKNKEEIPDSEAPEVNAHELAPGVLSVENVEIGKWVVSLWKNKTKTEWYAVAVNKRNSESLPTVERASSRAEAILNVRALIANYTKNKQAQMATENFNADAAIQAIKSLSEISVEPINEAKFPLTTKIMGYLGDGERVSKGELAQRLYGSKGINYDVSIPQDWLNDFHKKLGINTREENYASSFIWAYPKGNAMGEPVPLTKDAHKLLNKYFGMVSMRESVEQIDEKKEKPFRTIRNKQTGKTEKQYPHLVNGKYEYLPINDKHEIVEEVIQEEDESMSESEWSPSMETIQVGRNTFMIWKHKSKTEWYGISYVTKTGETTKTLETGNSRNAVIKLLRANLKTGNDVHESVEDEGLGVIPADVIEALIEKYQASGKKIEAFEQLVESWETTKRTT